MSETRPKRIPVRAILRVQATQTLQHPWLAAIVFFTAAAAPMVELIAPLYLRQFFNVLASGTPSPQTGEALVDIIGMFALFSLLAWGLFRIMLFCLTRLELQVMRELVSTSFYYLIRHSYSFFNNNFAGSLTHKVNKFHRAYEVVIDTILMTFMPTLLFVGGAAVILFIHNQTLGLILGGWAIGIVLFQLYVAKKRHPLRTERADQETKLTGTLADSIGNHLTSVLFSGSKHEHERVDAVARVWEKLTKRYWDVEELVWGALGLLMVAINIALLWVAMVFWLRGELTIGDFVLIQSYLLSAFGRLIGMNRELRKFFDAFADAGEMVTILKTPHEIADVAGARPLAIQNGTIDFKNVEFFFHKDAGLLNDFSLSIKGGERVALVGPSGAGKSTITKLLLRLYEVNSGTIEIDGQNIAKVTQDSLREAIGFVPQEPILFHRTLMENIRYGRRGATDEEVIEAAKQAHCHEFISTLPEGYNTYVGERGVKLSGGERQRVAIARAILKNAPILILDEATSSLDSESEALIQDALVTLMEGKTVLVIAHRLSTIMKMDRILVLENGKIVSEGTHSELLAETGLYKKLWSIQAGGFIQDEV